jgi:hypothetical protein
LAEEPSTRMEDTCIRLPRQEVDGCRCLPS